MTQIEKLRKPGLVCVLSLLFCGKSYCIGARGATGLTSPSELFFDGGTPLSADLIQNYEDMKRNERPIETQNYIPMNMAPSENFGSITNQVADKAFGTWLQDPDIQKSQVGRSAKSVEKAMKQEVSFGKPSGTQHRVGVQMLAFQSKCQMAYSGWTNAAVSYLAREQAWLFEVKEPLPKQKEIILSHSAKADEEHSNVTISWNW